MLMGVSQLCRAFDMQRIEQERVARRDSILKLITGATMPEDSLLLTDFGACGDGTKDCLPAFRRALRTAEKRGGARIIIPAGTYLVKGPIHLVSNVCLDVRRGATIKFDPAPELYLPVVKTSWEGTFLNNYSPFIYGYGLHGVSIIGDGTIDGNASTTFSTWKSRQKQGQARSREMNHKSVPNNERNFGDGWWLRPQLIQLFGCQRVTLSGVKITNAPFWCVHLLKSENIICRGLRYDAKLVNNDGIDPECSRNILIEDIEFDNGDDNVAIKAGRDNDGWAVATPSENIVIRRCRFKGLHAVVIGSEMSAGVRNVFVEDCTFGGYCKRGIYVKTNPDRGGYVSNLYVNNCEFGEVEDLFYVTSMYAGEGMDNDKFTKVSDIYINGVSCDKATAAGLVLQGTVAEPIRRVVFGNIEIGQAANAVSFDNTEGVEMFNCHIGGRAGVPSQAK